jgi:hypothetical protein
MQVEKSTGTGAVCTPDMLLGVSSRLVEHSLDKRKAMGSSPIPPTNYVGRTQVAKGAGCDPAIACSIHVGQPISGCSSSGRARALGA